jgi:hypothetical protein
MLMGLYDKSRAFIICIFFKFVYLFWIFKIKTFEYPQIIKQNYSIEEVHKYKLFWKQ